MSQPRLHHYVPQFYLSRFADTAGRLWAWNKSTDAVFQTSPCGLAAERDFYRQEWLASDGHDPMTMERQFADLEAEVAAITGQWLDWLRDGVAGDVIPMPDPNREIVALYLALQHLRTADFRDILSAYVADTADEDLSDAKVAEAHTALLWREDVFRPLQARLQACAWIFARNLTDRPFVTSDNPLAFKTGDNRCWVKAGVMASEVYAVYPMAPDVILYCHPLEGRAAALQSFDASLSPVVMQDEMVEHENSGQVFGAMRFVLSRDNEFDFARAFARSIGTDLYAPPGLAAPHQDD